MAKSASKKVSQQVEKVRSKPPQNLGSSVFIKMQQVKVTNLNYSPEKHGTEKVERVDLSLQILLENDAIPQFLLSDPNDLPDNQAFHQLWDDEGTPRFMITKFELPIKIACSVEIGNVKEKKAFKFESATLKSCTLDLMFDYKALLTCKVRVDPGEYFQMLRAATIAGMAKFSLNGATVLPNATDGDDDAQAKLPV